MNIDNNYSLKLFQNLNTNANGPKTGDFPRARSGHRMVANNNYLYLFGGYNPVEEVIGGEPQRQSPLLRDLWRYNILSKRWQKLSVKGKVPKEVASHTLWLHHNYLIVFGGTDVPFGFQIGREVKVFNLESQTWKTLKTSGEKPLPCYGQGVAIYKNKMVVLGGTSGTEYFFNMHILDLDTKIWKQVYRHIPTCTPSNGSYRHEIAIWEDKVYCFGGGTDVEIYLLEKILVFDLTEEGGAKWHEITTKPDPSAGYPQERNFHGLTQRDKDVYISGGKTMENPLDDIWHIDLTTLTWQKLNISLPRPVYFHSMAMNRDGRLFVFGGVSLTESQVERVDDFSSFWVAVPPLLSLALDSVAHYFPHLLSVTELPYPLAERFL